MLKKFQSGTLHKVQGEYYPVSWVLHLTPASERELFIIIAVLALPGGMLQLPLWYILDNGLEGSNWS